jgi:general secretion pathway protein K
VSRPNEDTSERGVALLATTAALAILGVLTLAMARTVTVEQRLVGHTVAAAQADALVRSGITTAGVLLADWAALGLPDTLDAPWAAPVGRQHLGAGWVEVRVEDEARRLDPNRPAAPDVLARLLSALDLPAELAPAVEDWIDGDDETRAGGAERSWYADRPGAPVPANAPLESVGELALVRGFDVETLERLRPFVTVTGEGRVNPNTAPPEVLEAWLGDPRRVRELLAARVRAPLGCDDLPGCTQHSRHFRVTAVAGVGEMRRAAEAIVWIAGREPEVVGWRRLVPPDDAS